MGTAATPDHFRWPEIKGDDAWTAPMRETQRRFDVLFIALLCFLTFMRNFVRMYFPIFAIKLGDVNTFGLCI